MWHLAGMFEDLKKSTGKVTLILWISRTSRYHWLAKLIPHGEGILSGIYNCKHRPNNQ